jgi:hypothetical protein
MKIAVEMAARIDVVESQKIAEEQALVLNQDQDTEQVTLIKLLTEVSVYFLVLAAFW